MQTYDIFSKMLRGEGKFFTIPPLGFCRPISLAARRKMGVPGLLPSGLALRSTCRRILQEGGYEADRSMYHYNKPSPFRPEVEELIVTKVRDLLGRQFR